MNKHYGFISKKTVMILVLLVSFCITIAIFLNSSLNKIHNLVARADDKEITIEWNNAIILFNRTINIDIFQSDTLIDHIETNKIINNFTYEKGNHGKLYDFKIYYTVGEKIDGDIETCSSMFIDMSKMPNIPVISITTDDYIWPKYDELSPNGRYEIGVSITNNEYVKGNMSLSFNGNELFNKELDIKCRGNSSAYREKIGYKIKLKEKEDLFQRDNDIYLDDEYILLGRGEDINWLTGLYFSDYFGVEWQPEYEYVNLFINGDYRGCYLLIESVKKSEGRVNISDSGYLIENTAYWWNNNDEYFRTHHQIMELGYILKYPEKYIEKNVSKIKQYLNDFESYLYSNDERYSDYIDTDSFISWLMVSDVLGCTDSAGTNMFLAKYDFNEDNPTSSKLKMITNWDLDSQFNTDEWCPMHSGVWYFGKLFGFDSFRNDYIDKWLSLKDRVLQDFSDYLFEFETLNGSEIQKSWDLDSERFRKPKNELDAMIKETITKIENKVSFINDNIYNVGSQ